ncbi:unnamed protein product [Prunus armeniaca]
MPMLGPMVLCLLLSVKDGFLVIDLFLLVEVFKATNLLMLVAVFKATDRLRVVSRRLVLCQNAKFVINVDTLLSIANIGMFLLNTQPHRSSPLESLTAMIAQTSFSPETFWIANSGASHHMVPTMDQLDSGRSNQGIYPIPGVVPPVDSSTLVDGSFSLAIAYVGQQIKSSVWHNRLGLPTNECLQTDGDESL